MNLRMSMVQKQKYYVVCLFALAVLNWVYLSPLQAEQPRDYGDLSVFGAANPGQELEVVAGQQSRASSQLIDKVFQAKFYRTIALIKEGNNELAKNSLQDLVSVSKMQGYSNLSEYSIELVRMALQFEDSGNFESARFAIEGASLLSPSHPKVNLLISSFWRSIGYQSALRYFSKSVEGLWNYPTLGWALSLNVFYLMLIGLTISFVVACVIQFLRGGELVSMELGRIFPRHRRGIFGPVMFALVLILPMKFGLVASLAVWSVALSYCKRGCSLLGVCCGLVIVAWGVFLPYGARIGVNVQDEGSAALDEIFNNNYAPGSEQQLLESLHQDKADPYVLFGVAQSLHRRGLSFEAQGLYQRVVDALPESSPMHISGMMNLGAINFNDGRVADAQVLFESLERRRYRSFELFYNLALINWTKLDTVGQRKYIKLAKEIDASRLDQLLARGLEQSEALVGTVPSSVLGGRALKPISSDESVFKIYQHKIAQVSQVSMSYGSPMAFIVVGFVSVLFGISARRKWTSPRRKRQTLAFDMSMVGPVSVSRLWGLFPGGMSIASDSPYRGVCVLAGVIALLIAAFDAPVRVFPMLPVAVSFQVVLLILASLLVIGSLAFSFYSRAAVVD